MGKRSKVRNLSNEDQNVSNKKIKMRRNTSENLEESITEQTNDVVLPVIEKKIKNTKNKSKLKKKSSKDSDVSTTKEIDDVVVETVEKKPKSKPKSTDNDDTNVDESIEVPAASGATNNKQKKKTLFNDDEEEVKEEDIDKFCDELDEEDNKQYEDWVKLIEANFRSNKKT